jgi:lipoprotein-releasing system permease protein
MKNLSLHIARRYLMAKKSHTAINIISIISVIGVAVSATAMIVILSVFNGLDNLVRDIHAAFYPDIEIRAAEGKSFVPDSTVFNTIKSLEGVVYYSQVVQDNALVKYEEKQHIGTIKGVEPHYKEMNRLDTAIVKGEFILQVKDRPFAVAGYGVRVHLNLDPAFSSSLHIYYPKRGKHVSMIPEKAFRTMRIHPAGVFMLNQAELDSRYIFVPIGFARELFGYTDEVTSVELKISRKARAQKVQEKIKSLLGPGFLVRDRYEQNALLYKILNSEKWAIFAILSFVLIIASFNILGSLTMLIFDKRKDIAILRSMGARKSQIRRVFFIEGWLISIVGAIIGLAAGLALAWGQMTYGWVKLQEGGSYIIQSYPVIIKASDFLLVGGTILAIGMLASWYPVRVITRKYLNTEEIS